MRKLIVLFVLVTLFVACDNSRVFEKNYEIKNVDFKIGTMDFEIGGKNKSLKQIKTVGDGYIVKDDIESGYLNTIPLWYFGLMY